MGSNSLLLQLAMVLAACCAAKISQDAVMNQKVVIIGAGVSGLSAAQRLYSKGIRDITILEAEDRIGGRLHTVDHDGHKIELGAQWIHGDAGNPVYKLLSEDVELLNEDESGIYDDDDEIYFASGKRASHKVQRLFYKSRKLISKMEKDVANRIENLNQSDEDLKNISLYDIATDIWNRNVVHDTEEGRADRDVIFKNVEDLMSTVDGDIFANLGILMYYYFVEYPGGDIEIPAGYSVLLRKLTQNIPDSVIKLRSKVKSIIWDRMQSASGLDENRIVSEVNEGLNVQLQSPQQVSGSNSDSNSDQVDAEVESVVSLPQNAHPVQVQYLDANSNLISIPVDHVILTVSLGYLKEHHKSLLVPNFSLEKQKSLDILGFGTVNKIILYYAQPFWGEREFDFYPLWDHYGGTDEFADENHWCRHLYEVFSFQGSYVVAFANAAASEKISRLSKTEVASTLVTLIRKFKDYTSVPEPDEVLVTNWGDKESFLGSYSCTAVGETLEMKREVFEPLTVGSVPRVLFAGEATHESRFSTIDGAYMSGIREADRLLGLQSKK